MESNKMEDMIQFNSGESSNPYNNVYLHQVHSGAGFEGFSGSVFTLTNGFARETAQVRLWPVNADENRWMANVVKIAPVGGYYVTCVSFQEAVEWVQRLVDRKVVLVGWK
jgi:hypothetical protein